MLLDKYLIENINLSKETENIYKSLYDNPYDTDYLDIFQEKLVRNLSNKSKYSSSFNRFK